METIRIEFVWQVLLTEVCWRWQFLSQLGRVDRHIGTETEHPSSELSYQRHGSIRINGRPTPGRFISSRLVHGTQLIL